MTIPTARAAPLDSSALNAAKRVARIAALAVRGSCDPAWGAALPGVVLKLVPPGAVVGGFWPLPAEIDVRPLLVALHERGHTIGLPRTPPRGQALIFHEWRPGDRLVPGRFGTMAPDTAPVMPDWLLVPLLGFDRTGHRLGYGAGYYDRTIAGLSGVRTIGCAFAAQEIPLVPAGPHDMKLDAIATECGVIPLRT